jgi:hypothetical protein
MAVLADVLLAVGRHDEPCPAMPAKHDSGESSQFLSLKSVPHAPDGLYVFGIGGVSLDFLS